MVITKHCGYDLTRFLGSGAYADVYLASKRGKQVAVKIFSDIEPIRYLDREYACLSSLDHPAIVKTKNFIREARTLVLEYIPGITPEEYEAYEPFPWLLDIAEAVAYCHDQRIAHRDIMACNIRIKPDNHGVLLDFGCGTRRPTESDKRLDLEGLGELIRVNCIANKDLKQLGRDATFSEDITARDFLIRLREIAGCQPLNH